LVWSHQCSNPWSTTVEREHAIHYTTIKVLWEYIRSTLNTFFSNISVNNAFLSQDIHASCWHLISCISLNVIWYEILTLEFRRKSYISQEWRVEGWHSHYLSVESFHNLVLFHIQEIIKQSSEFCFSVFEDRSGLMLLFWF
jgi:hypothetical protein